jgi:hypothetical protein
MLWSTKSWCLVFGIWEKPCRIRILGLLIRKTRSQTVFNVRALVKSCKIIRISSSLSHLSRASTTSTYGDGQELLSSLDNGRRTSWRHWSRRDWLAISFCSIIASEINRWICGTLRASCTAKLVKNLPAWPTSPPPLEKKKLAPRCFWSKYLWATVRAIVDFHVPAKPFSQKMPRSSCPSAQPYIRHSRSTRVSDRQRGKCCLLCELNGASAADGRRSSSVRLKIFLSLFI